MTLESSAGSRATHEATEAFLEVDSKGGATSRDRPWRWTSAGSLEGTRIRLHRYPIECRVPMFEMVLDLRNKLREVHIERDDGHGDLPTFEDFRMDFADDADRLAGDENTAGTAF